MSNGSAVRALNDRQTDLGCGHALAPLVIGKDHGQLLIKSALHSLKNMKSLC